jgi:SAM-dependent methyltransferase
VRQHRGRPPERLPAGPEIRSTLGSVLDRLALRGSIKLQARRLHACLGLVPGFDGTLPGPYFIKAGYVERLDPDYDDEQNWGQVVWQPDAYPRVAALARQVGSSLVVDVGCGNGKKLSALRPEFETVGVDIGSNLAVCRDRYPAAEWLEHDLDSSGALPVPVEGATVVCADVIEHVLRPERLLEKIRPARAIVLTTPERVLHWGRAHAGPPPNRAHVREWAWHEFRAFLASEGFEGRMELTRSRATPPHRSTILATLTSRR